MSTQYINQVQAFRNLLHGKPTSKNHSIQSTRSKSASYSILDHDIVMIDKIQQLLSEMNNINSSTQKLASKSASKISVVNEVQLFRKYLIGNK
ncbi:MAG: hypothetical protein MRJ93_15155 [Nitrososphaeraceae archaeon]|nr:hypothetical protein [Nitrososphaeraceae archaeon]